MNNQNGQIYGSSSPQAPSPIPMATPPNTVRYPMNSQTNFFLCRNCRNHISSWNSVIRQVRGEMGSTILCRDVVNVKTDPRPTSWYFNDLPVVFCYCKGCNRLLGERLLDRDRLDHGIHEGNYLLRPAYMLHWNGSQLRYADTDQPVEADTTP